MHKIRSAIMGSLFEFRKGIYTERQHGNGCQTVGDYINAIAHINYSGFVGWEYCIKHSPHIKGCRRKVKR